MSRIYETSNMGTPSSSQRKKPKSIELSKWLNHMEPHFATIHSILEMKKKQKKKFLCYDRNFLDLVGKKGHYKEIFKNCYKLTYTHDKDLSGWIQFDDEKEASPFEFHLNYMKHTWFPLKGGKVPNSFEIMIFQGLAGMEHIGRHFKSYPEDTRVGWRGPLIPWDIVKKEKRYLINDML